MRRTRLSAGIVLTLLLSLTLAACTRPAPSEEPAKVLNIGATGEPAGLDMITAAGAGTPFVLLYNVYETLVKLDGEGNVKPLLASEWTLTPDRLEYTFTLDGGAKFASGGDIHAEAVVASFERARIKGYGSVQEKWAPVDSVEAVDENTVKVTMKQPSNQWLFDMAGSAGIITDPAGVDTLDTKPAGSGPYTFANWEQGSFVELKKNPNYWGTPARFDDVFFRYYADPNAMNTAMLSGQLDIISNLTVPTALDQFKDESRFKVYEGTTTGEVVMGFNHRTEALKDLKVRQAINHAIDREALVESVWGGKGPLIGSMVPPTDPWYEDLSNTYEYDPAKAKSLLAEAGKATGLTLRLRVPNLPYGPPAGRFISAQLKEVGINAVVEELEFARWLDLVYSKHDFDMTIVAHVELRDMALFATPESYLGYDNPAYQALLAEADTLDEAGQTEKLKEAAKLLADDAAADWLFLLPNIIITTPQITGVQENQTSLSFDVTMLAAGA